MTGANKRLSKAFDNCNTRMTSTSVKFCIYAFIQRTFGNYQLTWKFSAPTMLPCRTFLMASEQRQFCITILWSELENMLEKVPCKAFFRMAGWQHCDERLKWKEKIFMWKTLQLWGNSCKISKISIRFSLSKRVSSAESFQMIQSCFWALLSYIFPASSRMLKEKFELSNREELEGFGMKAIFFSRKLSNCL